MPTLYFFFYFLFFFSGGLIYLLDLYANGTNPVVRERSAELFSKMMSDKLIGPKVKIVLSKFLPAIFMDAMRDNASASVHMFEGKASRSLSQGTNCGDMKRYHVTATAFVVLHARFCEKVDIISFPQYVAVNSAGLNSCVTMQGQNDLNF